MANPDFVQEVLDYLDTNWDTNTYSPKPRLIDGDELRDNSDDSRARDPTPVEEVLITVNSAPTGQNEPIGTEFDFRSEYGVSLIIEAYHEDGGQGPENVADKDEFDTVVGEARRSVLVEREFPVGDFTWLTIEDEADRSAEQPMNAHYFRYEFDIWFRGFESLP